MIAIAVPAVGIDNGTIGMDAMDAMDGAAVETYEATTPLMVMALLVNLKSSGSFRVIDVDEHSKLL